MRYGRFMHYRNEGRIACLSTMMHVLIRCTRIHGVVSPLLVPPQCVEQRIRQMLLALWMTPSLRASEGKNTSKGTDSTGAFGAVDEAPAFCCAVIEMRLYKLHGICQLH